MHLYEQCNRTFREHKEVILYLIFGVLTTVVNWLAYAAFVWIGLDINVSNILSWIVGVSFAFVVNKWYVFESRSLESRKVIKEFGSFVGARIFTGIIAILLFPLLYNIGLNQRLFEDRHKRDRDRTQLDIQQIPHL